MSQPTISVILITKNEAALIRQALDSIAWADDIVVVDSGSTDGTVEICREYTDKVFVTDWPGFGPQKNRALNHATGDRVLSIGADEQVTSELAQEIRAAIAVPTADAYRLPRLSSFCGRIMRHSGWWPDGVLRLFLRGKGSCTHDRVHERLLVEGAVQTLSGLLLHHSFRSLDQVLAKVNHYSSKSAEMLFQRRKRAGPGTAIAHGAWAFFRTYFLRAGFLDGRQGFILAVFNAEGTYYRYLKFMYLWERWS